MLDTAPKTADSRGTTTAEDTLKRKSRDAGVVSGGHLVAKALKNEGVDTIFTLCGGHIIDIYDGCVDEGIRIIDVRHEQVAAHAADGYARQTGKLGCVVTTAGPGCTNAVTGIATAFRSESPVLHIGGQGALTQHKMGSLQDLPHVDMMSPITKFAATVPSTERVADMVSMAAREAFNGAPGPVYLEIPRDVLDREVDLTKAVVPAARPLPRLDATRSATRATSRSWPTSWSIPSGRRSSTASRSGRRAAHEEAIALLRGLDIPGYFNGGSRGLLPPGDPHHFDRTRGNAFADADVIVIVGTPFDFRMGYGRRISNKLTLVQIDMDYRTVGKNRDISLGLVGRSRARSWARCCRRPPAASSRTSGRRGAQWMQEAERGRSGRHREADAAVQIEQLPDPSVPRRLGAQRVPRATTPSTSATAAMWSRSPRRRCGRVAPASGWIRARSARSASAPDSPSPPGSRIPNKEVLCYYGDGSFGMTAFDMETANRFGVPYIAVIGNNSAMNQIRYGQLAKYGEERGNVGNLLGDVPFGKFAEMLGGYGEEVRDPAQIAPALQRARESVRRLKRSAVINIWVDPREYAPGTKNQTMYK